MSDFGIFMVDRGLFDHPAFPDEPFTAREAWLWMIGTAVKKPRSRRVGNFAVDLARGQFAYSHRFLAKRWQWSVARVQRFLSRLVAESMIKSVTESGVTCVTICNYDKFQNMTERIESVAESGPIQIEETLTTDSESVVVAESRARARQQSYISQQAFDLADEIMLTFEIDKAFIPPGWCGAPMWLQAGLNSGWRPELVRIAAAKIRARRNFRVPYSFKYLAQPIQREHEIAAEPHLPIPPVIASQNMEPLNAAKVPVAEDWKQSRDAFRRARGKLKASLNDAAAKNGGDGSGSVVRFAPATGSRRP